VARLVRGNLVFVWLTLLTVALGFVGYSRAASDAQQTASARTARFEEINVRRLNIVEPDGKPRVVVSSRARMPGLYWGGKEYRHHSRDDGGFLFFNDEGDEVGGMTFSSRREGDNTSVHSGLLFDQYKQDQTVGLVYNERNGQRAAGIRVWDRPDQSLLPVIELSDKAARAASDAEREAIRAEMTRLAQSWGPMGERLFAGKERGASIVRLADGNGRPRLVLKVEASGEPRVEFLDEAGKVVRRYPQ
jgi:hypothetical protein